MEAHPVDAWQDEDNQKDKISVASPKTLAERCAVEGACATKLALRIPAIIDDLANSTEEAYTAWPDRLYVIDRRRPRRLQEQARTFWIQTRGNGSSPQTASARPRRPDPGHTGSVSPGYVPALRFSISLNDRESSRSVTRGGWSGQGAGHSRRPAAILRCAPRP